MRSGTRTSIFRVVGGGAHAAARCVRRARPAAAPYGTKMRFDHLFSQLRLHHSVRAVRRLQRTALLYATRYLHRGMSCSSGQPPRPRQTESHMSPVCFHTTMEICSAYHDQNSAQANRHAAYTPARPHCPRCCRREPHLAAEATGVGMRRRGMHRGSISTPAVALSSPITRQSAYSHSSSHIACQRSSWSSYLMNTCHDVGCTSTMRPTYHLRSPPQ